MSMDTAVANLATTMAAEAALTNSLERLSYAAAGIVKLRKQFGSTTEIVEAETAIQNRIETLAGTVTDLNELAYAAAGLQHIDNYFNQMQTRYSIKLQKQNDDACAFGTDLTDVYIETDIVINVNDQAYHFASGAVVTLPTLILANDYKIYGTPTGLVAQPYADPAPLNSVLLGGFHVYHTTGGVNPYSLWDILWRPTCNPRAMTINPGKSAWGDIYLMDVDYGINGYSRPDVKIADGENAASFPKRPIMYGGDGTVTYPAMTWFNAQDLARAHGKRLFREGEYSHFAYGVVEAQAVGTDPINTKYQAGHRSLCGLEQATGAMWIWGDDIQGNAAGGWAAITDGRGSIYHSGLTAVILGADWFSGANAGSRSAYWNYSPSSSSSYLSGRGACDHLKLVS